jgi:hypothetical protein
LAWHLAVCCHASQEKQELRRRGPISSKLKLVAPASAGIFLFRLAGYAIFPAMEKASDLGKPTVPIDLIGPEHWARSSRRSGRTTKVICLIVGGLATAGIIAYGVFGGFSR